MEVEESSDDEGNAPIRTVVSRQVIQSSMVSTGVPFRAGAAQSTPNVPSPFVSRPISLNANSNRSQEPSASNAMPICPLDMMVRSVKNERVYSRSYMCTECAQKFPDIQLLKKHLREHVKETRPESPNRCRICDKKLSSKANLKRHMNTVHKN